MSFRDFQLQKNIPIFFPFSPIFSKHFPRLTAAMEYYEQLKDSCLSTGSTAMERAARRTEEIQSLKEAMDLLETGTP